MEGARLECRFTAGAGPVWGADYWETGNASGTPWTPGPRFAGEQSGLRINGAFLNTPVPAGIRVATMPNNGVGYPINITPYIQVRHSPSNPINIRAGDTLGLLRLTSSNNYDATRPQLTVTYTAANNFTISPSTCTINNNNPIEINFGNVHQRAIGTDPLTTSVRSNRRLTYSCPDGGITTPITITYKGSPSSFDTRLLLMTNPDVLILDEATEGLAPLIAREIWRICGLIRESGISSVIVDKNWKHVTRITDRNVILVKGEVVFEGSSADLLAQPGLLEQHLGV